MAPPFVFPSSLRDLEQDADGDGEPSLRPQNPVAVAALRAADLEEFVNDVRQWECISYCLSQLTFTEKGLKKLIDNFKMFEHALSEDSVMNHFRNVIAKCRKFAKPDLKVCIEEFEEKLSKVHQEKREQATTRNAEAHKQRIGSLDGFLVTKEVSQNNRMSAEEETSEVIDPSVDSNAEDKENMPECSDNICSENSQTSSTFTESEGDSGVVQSARTFGKGLSRSSIKKIREPVLKDSAESAPVRRVARSSRRCFLSLFCSLIFVF